MRLRLLGFFMICIAAPCFSDDAKQGVDSHSHESTDVDTASQSLPEVLVSVKLHWQGVSQHVSLFSNGLLATESAIGWAEFPVERKYQESDYFNDVKNLAKIEVVELGLSDYPQALFVTLPPEPGEDPPLFQQLYISQDNTLHRVFTHYWFEWGANKVNFPGDGTIVYQEDRWEACQHDKSAEIVDLNIVTFAFDDRRFTEIGRRMSSEMADCVHFAACPYVYMMVNGRQKLIGEILRNVIGEDAYTNQKLSLPTESGLVRIELREEKKEVTFLDSISLIVDGVEILPSICDDIKILSFCNTDKVYHRLNEGDSLKLLFNVPQTATTLELSATGYYDPL